MTTKWITASLPAGTGTDGEGGTHSQLAGAGAPTTGTAATDIAAAFTDYNTFAASLLAITGDTYSTTTHQFTTGGATGLTHAQWATQAALLNTALSDFNTVKTDITTQDSSTVAIVPSQSVTVGYDSALSTNQVKAALHKIILGLGN